MNFDFISGSYARIETMVFGSRLQATRVSLLDEVSKRIGKSSKILLIGDGDGRFFEQMAKTLPDASYTYLERSEKMLSLARKRVTLDVEWLHGGLEKLQGRQFDLVVTHFVLDCYNGNELEKVVVEIGKCSKKGGYWLLSDFSDSGGWWARGLIAVMYYFFRIVARVPARQLGSFGKLLEHNDWCECAEVEKLRGLCYSQLWEKKN